MAKSTKAGFFNIETVRAVCEQTDLNEAKKIALARIAETPEALPENIYKATVMVEKATSVKSLGISIANFMLAHPLENLKTIR